MITGASAGVGRAAARAFAGKGARIGLLARGRDGLTPLMHAVDMGHDEQVGFLLARGADPNAEANGETPLTFAAAQGREDITALLRQAGALAR